MSPAEFCRTQGAPAGSTFYYACLYQPATDQSLLYPLLALYNELSGLIYRSTDPGAARISLGWWADELKRLHQNTPRHPITLELQRLYRTTVPPDTDLQACLPANEWFLRFDNVTDDKAWLGHHRQRIEPLAAHAAAACRLSIASQIQACIELFTCVSALEQLHHLQRLYAAGRHPLPTDLLQTHAVSAADLAQRAEGRNIHDLFAALLQRLLSELETGRQIWAGNDDRRFNFCRVLNAILLAQGREYLAADKNIMQQHIALSPLRKLWIAWRNRYTNVKV
ncbi:MAG: squalene/phytoene synthase family protein [Gammaproteobacteria bacterium]